MDSDKPKVVARLSIPRAVAERLPSGRFLEWTTAQLLRVANKLGLDGVALTDVQSMPADKDDPLFVQHFDFYAVPRQPMLPPTQDADVPDESFLN